MVDYPSGLIFLMCSMLVTLRILNLFQDLNGREVHNFQLALLAKPGRL